MSDHISSQLATAKAQMLRGLRAARTGDTPPEVSEEPLQRTDRRARVAPAVADAFVAAMRSKAAPRVLELVLRSFARHAAGKPWTAAIFDDAMTLRVPVADDVLGALARVLAAHAEQAIRAADRAFTHHETEEQAHAHP